jgi:hypothetical protein
MQIPVNYFVDNGDERLGLFRLLTGIFCIRTGLYPGCFVHFTPSFVISQMVYVDMDKRCEAFFRSEKRMAFYDRRKEYEKKASYRFYKQDFSDDILEKEGSFDILFSLYAGFISKYCVKYLKKGKILLANNSHGNAPLACLDKSYELIGAVKRDGNNFYFTDKDLYSYFIPKGKKAFDKETIEKTMKGPAYTWSAYAYVFRKVT